MAATVLGASLWAPWADATEGLIVGDSRINGWSWLGGGVVATVAFTAVSLLAVAALALATRVPRHLLVLLGAAVAASAGSVLLTGLGDRDIAVPRVDTRAATNFSLSAGEGPLVMLIGLALAAAGLALLARDRELAVASVPVRMLGLLVCGVLLLFAPMFHWTWLGGNFEADAWEVYDWADVGIIVMGVVIGFAGTLRPQARLLVLPAVAVALPFLDAGVSSSAPGGISKPDAYAASAVGPGLVLAFVATVGAAALLPYRGHGKRRPTNDIPVPSAPESMQRSPGPLR